MPGTQSSGSASASGWVSGLILADSNSLFGLRGKQCSLLQRLLDLGKDAGTLAASGGAGVNAGITMLQTDDFTGITVSSLTLVVASAAVLSC